MAALSLQMVGEGYPDHVIFETLRQRYPDRDKTDKELRDLIAGAHRLGPRPAARVRNRGYHYPRTPTEPMVKPFEPTAEAKPLPTDLAETTPIDFLRRLYKPGELICITWPDGNGKPTQDDIWTVNEWAQLFAGQIKPEDLQTDQGIWFCVNPLKGGMDSPGRTNENVADFRYALVESDKGALEEQYANLINSGLPLAAVYTSAGDSVHGLVRIDAENADEYKARVAQVYEYCTKMPGLDPANKNPSRLSRLPGAMRGDRKQTLLSWAVGPVSWEDWRADIERKSDDTEWFSLDSLFKFTVIPQGGKMALGMLN
jgi:hypothetical protein